MKSIILYLNENVGILINPSPTPVKLPHQRTQEKIEDEIVKQLPQKDRLEYLKKREEKERKTAVRSSLIGLGVLGALGGATMLKKDK
jgi:hypothetical protein